MCAAVPLVRLRLINAFHWSIRYVVYGYPLPNVTWFKDGLPVVQNDVIYDHVTFRGDAMIKGGLMFKMSSHFNNGNYTLVATNMHGNASHTIDAVFLQSPGVRLRQSLSICMLKQNFKSIQFTNVILF